MGYDERQQPNASGALVAVIGSGLVLAILAIIVVAGVGLFWVPARTQQAQAVAMEERAIAELHRAGAEAHLADAMAQLEQSRVATTPDTRINFVLKLDREGNISVDDEMIGLDELKTRVAKAKSESSNEFLVRVIADSDCPKRHIKFVAAVFDEVGDVAWHVVSPENADAPLRGSDFIGWDRLPACQKYGENDRLEAYPTIFSQPLPELNDVPN
jgi:biopolymer transport protein ExbD